MSDRTEPQFFDAPDGTRLAWREVGQGPRTVVLIHGLFSSAEVNWIKYGHAAAIAERGFRVIMPDLRAHGASDAPTDPVRYGPDIIVDDQRALLAYLGLTGFDLGGYSLGGRTVMRLLIGGVRPRRAVIAGMGLAGMLDPEPRAAIFRKIVERLGSFERGDPAFMVQAFLKTTGGNPAALLPLLRSFVSSTREEIAAIATETLVLIGADDDENGSAADVADLLPNARITTVPGGHMSCITNAEFGQAIADFLDH